MVFVQIPPGEGVLGSSADEPHRGITSWSGDGDEFELPRKTEVSKAFWLGVTEVTNEQFRRFRHKHRTQLRPAFSGAKEELTFMVDGRSARALIAAGYSLDAADQPVACITWDDAVAFCKWLSELPEERLAGRTYRLPTEQEWEYACRGVSTGRFFWGEAAEYSWMYANVADASGLAFWQLSRFAFSGDDGHVVAASVGSYRPNAYGLHDMIGNVHEFCGDDFVGYSVQNPGARLYLPGDERPAVAVRGGSWASGIGIARCAARVPLDRVTSRHDVGFRVVVEIQDLNSPR